MTVILADGYARFHVPTPAKRKTLPKPFVCLECGTRMTLKQAERAVGKGCITCGSVDVDEY